MPDPVSRYDAFLFLHLLAAFALVGTMTAFWAVTLAGRPPQPLLPKGAREAIGRPLGLTIAIASVTVLVFGVALAIDVDGYELWDGWILASFLLWGVGTLAGERGGRWFQRASESGDRVHWQRGMLLQTTSTVAVLVLLAVMITKPGV